MSIELFESFPSPHLAASLMRSTNPAYSYNPFI
jgi:hypothetical protein